MPDDQPKPTIRYTGTSAEVLRHIGNESSPLPPRLDLRNHSPTFAWGDTGDGAAQLALALLADAVGDEQALPVYQWFKFEVIARLDKDKDWEMTRNQVLWWFIPQRRGGDED